MNDHSMSNAPDMQTSPLQKCQIIYLVLVNLFMSKDLDSDNDRKHG